MEIKEFIKNRKNQKIAVLVEEAQNQKGLAFVMHGFGGFKEQPHIQIMADAFKENSYTVVRFDTTNALGESDGKHEYATITTFYEDLEDVIRWASTQKWYEKPFCLVGHSLGGMSVALYAENYPEKVKGLAPISTVVSGKLSLETYSSGDRKGLEEWRRTGWKVEESRSKPGVTKRTPYSEFEERLKYDLLKKADKLVMPILLIVGEKDNGTPLKHQKILYDVLLGLKELHLIKGAPHTFREPEHLTELKQLFNQWIRKLA